MQRRTDIPWPDAKAQAERMLSAIMALAGASVGAVFVVDRGRLALLTSQRLDQRVLQATETAWLKQRPLLVMGREVVADSLLFLPVFSSGNLVGLLCLNGLDSANCPPDDLQRVLMNLGRTLLRAIGTAPMPSVEEVAGDEKREQLLALLNANEWNISRVARLMGKTRQTIYAWLERLGIPRKRVPKHG